MHFMQALCHFNRWDASLTLLRQTIVKSLIPRQEHRGVGLKAACPYTVMDKKWEFLIIPL